MGTNNKSGHAEYVRQHGSKNPDIDRRDNEDYFLIDRASFNQGINAQYDMIITGGGSTYVDSERTSRSCFADYKPCQSWNKIGALCATDYKWVQQEQVMQGKIIPLRKM